MAIRLKDFVHRLTGRITGVSMRDREDVQLFQVYPEHEFETPALSDLLDADSHAFPATRHQVPAGFVAVIRNGRCRVGREEVLSSANRCFLEITSQKRHPLLGKSAPRKVRRVDATVAHLSLSGLEDNYYHFCVEWLARYHLLGQAVPKVDYYLVPRRVSFQEQYLALLGIDPAQVLPAEQDEYLEAATLVVPSLINNHQEVYYRGCRSFAKQWLPRWLPEVYQGRFPTPAGGGAKRVYVSRGLAAGRRIENEAELADVLQQFGFASYSLELLSVPEQISLFADAEAIVSVHGAGLANICHCRPGTVILELYPEHYLDPSIRLLALALGHRYEYLVGSTPDTLGINPQLENLYLAPERLARALAILCEKYALQTVPEPVRLPSGSPPLPTIGFRADDNCRAICRRSRNTTE